MPEEASQVEDVGVETSEVTESTGTETTTEETATQTISFAEEGSDLAAINLDGLREKYGEAHPELVEFAKSLQGDYTQKTQLAATERRALDTWATQLQEQHDAKMAQLDPSNLPNFENLTPEQTAQWLISNIVDQVKPMIQQELGPMQDQIQAQQYDKDIGDLVGQHPLLDDPMVRAAAADIAGQGLTPENALKAAAFDQLMADNTKLKNTQTKKTASAISQAGVSETGVTTKATDQKGMSWADAKAEAIRKMEAGELQ